MSLTDLIEQRDLLRTRLQLFRLFAKFIGPSRELVQMRGDNSKRRESSSVPNGAVFANEERSGAARS